MNLIRLGDDFGGWTIDIDLVPDTGTVIDAGIGFNTSFPEELRKLRPNLKFVFIDPVMDSLLYAQRRGLDFTSLHGAVSERTQSARRIYRLLQHSESLVRENRNVNRKSTRTVSTFGLSRLVETYNPVLMKLDLEGEEYKCYKQALGVPQFCFEFHHRNIRQWDSSTTEKAVQFFRDKGYKDVFRSPHDQITFIKQ